MRKPAALTLPLTNHMTWPQKRIAVGVGVVLAMRPKGGNGIYEHVSKLNTTQEHVEPAPSPAPAPDPLPSAVPSALRGS